MNLTSIEEDQINFENNHINDDLRIEYDNLKKMYLCVIFDKRNNAELKKGIFIMFFKRSLLSAVILMLCTAFSVFASPAGKNRENVRLLIPDKIYAVPGVETNIYFNNINKI